MDDEPDRAWIAFALMWAAVLFAAFAAVYLTVVGPANAQQPPCMPLPQFRDQLEKEFHEQQIGGGIIGQTHVVMLFASPDGETWTLIQVDTRGMACGIAAGTGWDQGRIPAIGERGA